MKTITLDWDTYIKELKEQYMLGLDRSGLLKEGYELIQKINNGSASRVDTYKWSAKVLDTIKHDPGEVTDEKG